jgi:hypothetical protein
LPCTHSRACHMWLPHWHCAAHAWEARGTSEISQGVKWLSYAVEITRNTRWVNTRSRQSVRQSPQAAGGRVFFYRRWSVKPAPCTRATPSPATLRSVSVSSHTRGAQRHPLLSMSATDTQNRASSISILVLRHRGSNLKTAHRRSHPGRRGTHTIHTHVRP